MVFLMAGFIRRHWTTYCPELKYCWCLLILCGRIRLPQFSKPRTTPPLSRTCKAEVLSKSCKLFCEKCIRVWFELRASDFWKHVSHLDKIASSYTDQFVKGHDEWTCVEWIGAIEVIVNNFFFNNTREFEIPTHFLVHRCWEARSNFSIVMSEQQSVLFVCLGTERTPWWVFITYFSLIDSVV